MSILESGLIQDLAFIGNFSNIYTWSPALMVDMDIFLFVDTMSLTVGHGLLALKNELSSKLTDMEIDFDLRVVEGPYKPPIPVLSRPIIVAHLGVFTEQLYLSEAPLKRWSWRKYSCKREISRLFRLAPEKPDVTEFLNGANGVRQRLRVLRSGRVDMREWILPDFDQILLHVTKAEPNFIECCFAYAASCARHHCRIIGLAEADKLDNQNFTSWYSDNVFASDTFVELMHLKSECRNTGFHISVDKAQTLAIDYIHNLERHLSSRLPAP
jgi:hypothetical protein